MWRQTYSRMEKLHADASKKHILKHNVFPCVGSHKRGACSWRATVIYCILSIRGLFSASSCRETGLFFPNSSKMRTCVLQSSCVDVNRKQMQIPSLFVLLWPLQNPTCLEGFPRLRKRETRLWQTKHQTCKEHLWFRNIVSPLVQVMSPATPYRKDIT